MKIAVNIVAFSKACKVCTLHFACYPRKSFLDPRVTRYLVATVYRHSKLATVPSCKYSG